MHATAETVWLVTVDALWVTRAREFYSTDKLFLENLMLQSYFNDWLITTLYSCSCIKFSVVFSFSKLNMVLYNENNQNWLYLIT
jgi:hypothetical protein